MTALASPDWLIILTDGHCYTYPVAVQPDETLRTHGWWRISEWRTIPGDSAWSRMATVEPL